MAFSKEVRIQELAASARHCCVCHRYKGVKVEVHHIVPVADGGQDTADNAIALCFDCHADAGHYNPDHPRGAKFSVDELRLARETWHEAVRTHGTQAPQEEDWLYCRYLICKSFSALSEIAAGSLADIPVSSPFLANTRVGDFLSSIVRRYPEPDRSSHIWGDDYEDRTGYERAHPTARIFERSSYHFLPFFEATRIPSREELLHRVGPVDPVTALLLGAAVPVAEISQAYAYTTLCGDSSFQEMYHLRPLWGVYLAATNLMEQPIRLEALRCQVEEASGLGFRTFRTCQAMRVRDLTMPRMALPKGATAIIPIAVVLGPLDAEPLGVTRAVEQDVATGEVQLTSHWDADHLINQLALVGLSLWPISFLVALAGQRRAQEVHQLDLSNLYTIDRYWQTGSCPHLFLERSCQPSLIYCGELWTRSPDEPQIETLEIPPAVKAVLLAELEDEVTHILEVTVNDVAVVQNCIMHKGQTLRVAASPGDRIRLTGFYAPHPAARGRRPDPWRKNQVISAFMDCFTSTPQDQSGSNQLDR